MSHNSLPSTQQQHHALVVSSSGQQPMPQRTMIAQRGSPSMVVPSKAGYGSSTCQQYVTQPGTAPHLVAYPAAAAPPKQKVTTAADLAQYSSTLGGGSVSLQNGTFQSTPVSSIHSTLGFDGTQMTIQHHHHTQHQQAQYVQTSQHHPHSHHQQQTVHNHQQYQAAQQSQSSVAGQVQYRQTAYTSQQNNHHHSYQQNNTTAPSQQHYQQRTLTQSRYNQKHQTSQPKQLLLNDAEVSVVHFATGSSSSATSGHSVAHNSVVVTDTNGQPEVDKGENEIKIGNSESSELDKSKVEKDSPSNASEKPSMANTKEKTPMCLINELARFNKMSHQYTLVDEQGPAHKKTFYVKLKLGDEEYSASGESIKKAQHAAAAIALAETKFLHPPPKPVRLGIVDLDKADGNLTPTVELNALAMKRGEATSYKSIEPQQPPYYHQPGMDFRGLYNHRYHHQFMRGGGGGGRDPRFHRGQGMMWPMHYHYPRMNRAFYVSLRVGHREFIGDGPTRQSARHNAAQKALRILNRLPIPNVEKKPEEEEEEESGIDDSLKSEISLVHEIALRRNMNVEFQVIRETGPPHMKNFVTRCTVAHLVTDGEGNSKKLSKKKAAEQMLEELHKLPDQPAPACPRPKPKNQINKKKNRNIIKSELQQQKADPNYGVGINPISRLIQIMQAQKKKEPVYTLVAERGLPRRREFIVQVEVEDRTCTGTGPNKKLAKRSAAEAMLQLLGYTKPSPQPTKSSFKNTSESGQSSGDRKVVTFSDGDSHSDGQSSSITSTTSSSPHQRVPGILHLPNKASAVLAGSASSSPSPSTTASSSSSTPINSSSSKENLVNLSSILKPNLRPEIQLRELCTALAYQLEIDDFTKKRPSGTEHITRITVGSLEASQSFHGSNTTLESSRDMAALDALKVILAKVKDVHPAGDGPQMKKELLIRSSPSLLAKKDLST